MTMSNIFSIHTLDEGKVIDIDNGITEKALAFVPTQVVERDNRIPINRFKGYIGQYYQQYLRNLNPEDQIAKLDGKVLKSQGFHKFIIAAWFDLLLGYNVADYDSGNPDYSKFGYQNTQEYASVKELLSSEILNNDTRYKRFENVTAGYYAIRSRELSLEYLKSGRKDDNLREKSRAYQLIAQTIASGKGVGDNPYLK